MKKLEYKGYLGSVEYSEEEHLWYGKVLDMGGICITYEGKSFEDLKADFEGAVDFYEECCADRK